MDRLPVSPIVSRIIHLVERKIGIEALAGRSQVPVSLMQAWRDGQAAMPREQFLRLVDLLLELDVDWEDWDGK